jgi:hypothetical protein
LIGKTQRISAKFMGLHEWAVFPEDNHLKILGRTDEAVREKISNKVRAINRRAFASLI